MNLLKANNFYKLKNFKEFDFNSKKGNLHFGHFFVISGCAVVLIAITFLKNGFKFELKKPTIQKQITYEEVYNRIALKDGNPFGSEPQKTDEAYSQLAMLDPDLAEQGQVAGTSIGEDGKELIIPSISQIISREELLKIPILLSSNNNLESIAEYKELMADSELQNSIIEVMEIINNQDKENLKIVSAKIEKILTLLMQIPAPSILAEYHKLNLIYYFQFSILAEGEIGGVDAIDPKITSSNIFGILERLEQIKSEIFSKYGVEL